MIMATVLPVRAAARLLEKVIEVLPSDPKKRKT